MRQNILFSAITLFLLAILSCNKTKIEPQDIYIEPAETRLGSYKGMFQECGDIVCYNKDTVFQVVKEDNKYFLIFGNHKDQIEYWTTSAHDFRSSESSSNINGPIFNGYCRNDSFFVVFTTEWGIYNNNLLSGKKQ